MKKLILLVAALALLVPTAAGAKRPPQHGTKNAARLALASKNAAFACKAQLKTMGATAFEQAWGANKRANGAGKLRNAYGKCVSAQRKHSFAAKLAELATGTLTVTAPTTGSTLETISLTGNVTRGRPVSTGTLTGTLTADLSKTVTKNGITCAPVTGTLTLSDTATPTANTLVKTLQNAFYCTGSAGSALFGHYTMTGTGTYATSTGSGIEALLASSTGAFTDVEFGSLAS